MDKIWEVAPRKFDDLIDQILYNRGVITDKMSDEAKEVFFSPDFKRDLPDPYLMKNLEKAVLRIKKARENNERIGIFSDYDADGIPGAAILYRALKQIGFDPVVYIPNRENGYGLSKEGIDFLKKEKCSLIITVDLGIRSILEARYCKSVGVDIIITDHHLPGEELPDFGLVINAKQKGDKYPYKELCGCAVAYKLIEGLSREFTEINEQFLKWNLDLVAISTISDVVPLTGENRILAKYGLMVMNKTKNLGLKKLIEISNLDPKNIMAYHVGFQIGPRINAPGRIDHATKSFELLVTTDEEEAGNLAKWLNEKNEERQREMDEVFKDAEKEIELKALDKDKIIVVSGAWKKGVIGPTASRLVEKYCRPVILFSKDKDVFTGSARSVSGVNIVAIFESVKKYIKKFGGHSGAAGITVEKEMYEKFIQEISDYANKNISDESLRPKVRVDVKVSLSELDKNIYKKILEFEPFGMGNPKPVFVAHDTQLDFPRFVGKEENHFSSIVNQDRSKMKSICFNFPYDKDMIKKEKKYDIVFNLTLDTWQGEEKLNLNIIDLKANA